MAVVVYKKVRILMKQGSEGKGTKRKGNHGVPLKLLDVKSTMLKREFNLCIFNPLFSTLMLELFLSFEL